MTNLYDISLNVCVLIMEVGVNIQSCYRYSRILQLPHVPDMVFPNNSLELKHISGCTIEFNALDALKRVSNGKLPLKIACADAWKESR